ALSDAMHERERLRVERDGAGSARDRQAMRDIGRRALRVQRLELVADGHALIELAQIRRAKQRLKIQLSDQDDLQELFLVGFEVGQDANLFEHVKRQVLR